MNSERVMLLITTYLSECERPEGFSDEAFWAWEHLDRLIRDRPDEAWDLVVNLLNRGTEGQIGAIAAGPLESLLARHGLKLLPKLNAEIKSNQRLRTALESVYLFDVPELEREIAELLDDRPRQV